eukprot:6674050-Prymnesium_polylepis.1
MPVGEPFSIRAPKIRVMVTGGEGRRTRAGGTRTRGAQERRPRQPAHGLRTLESLTASLPVWTLDSGDGRRCSSVSLRCRSIEA